MNPEDMSAVQLLKELDGIYREIWNRHNNGLDIMVLKDGTACPRYCPGCDTKAVVTCVELNLTPEQIEAINNSPALGENKWVRWSNFFERERKAGRMPPKPYDWVYDPLDRIPHEAGVYYMVNCECHASGWKKSQREAEEDYWYRNPEAGIRLTKIPMESNP